jgi:hypothetical protein
MRPPTESGATRCAAARLPLRKERDLRGAMLVAREVSRRNVMTRLLIIFATAAIAGCGGAAAGGGTTAVQGVDDGTVAPDSSVTLVNESEYAIYQMFMSPSSEPMWGPDQLGEDVLLPGESISLAVDCDAYDVRLVDDEGEECVLEDVQVCFEDAVWHLTDEELAICTVFTGK